MQTRILITGGGGMIGQRVARALLERGGIRDAPQAPPQLSELILFDQAFPTGRIEDARVQYVAGDMLDRERLARIGAPGIDAVFHFASVVSAGAEADFDLGMRVNVDGMRNLLELCRTQTVPPRLVFTSSVAAFGGEVPGIVLDTTAPTPQSSYGTQKVIGELLVSDYTRKGFIDGRSLRLPTIVIRPGKPNRAASGFMSSILREPLNGESAVCPVPAETEMWIASPARAVDMLIHAMELPADAWGWNRTLNAPGITVSVAEALAALERAAGREAVRLVRSEPDAAIAKLVLSWPVRFATERADTLGFTCDADIEAIVREHLRERGESAQYEADAT
jgi:nucleoside-diphosphate-sugar epimerase